MSVGETKVENAPIVWVRQMWDITSMGETKAGNNKCPYHVRICYILYQGCLYRSGTRLSLASG